MLLVGPSIGKLPTWAVPLEMAGANILLFPGHGRLGGGGGGSVVQWFSGSVVQWFGGGGGG